MHYYMQYFIYKYTQLLYKLKGSEMVSFDFVLKSIQHA